MRRDHGWLSWQPTPNNTKIRTGNLPCTPGLREIYINIKYNSYPYIWWCFHFQILECYRAIRNEFVRGYGSWVKHGQWYILTIVHFCREFFIPCWLICLWFRCSPINMCFIYIYSYIRIDHLYASTPHHLMSSGKISRPQINGLADFHFDRPVEKHHLPRPCLLILLVKIHHDVRDSTFAVKWCLNYMNLPNFSPPSRICINENITRKLIPICLERNLRAHPLASPSPCVSCDASRARSPVCGSTTSSSNNNTHTLSPNAARNWQHFIIS